MIAQSVERMNCMSPDGRARWSERIKKHFEYYANKLYGGRKISYNKVYTINSIQRPT